MQTVLQTHGKTVTHNGTRKPTPFRHSCAASDLGCTIELQWLLSRTNQDEQYITTPLLGLHACAEWHWFYTPQQGHEEQAKTSQLSTRGRLITTTNHHPLFLANSFDKPDTGTVVLASLARSISPFPPLLRGRDGNVTILNRPLSKTLMMHKRLPPSATEPPLPIAPPRQNPFSVWKGHLIGGQLLESGRTTTPYFLSGL